jgi:long-chain acyl-CoA synthetase
MSHDVVDYISPETVFTLDELFHERVRRSPNGIAYLYYDEQAGRWCELTWLAMLQEVINWQQALMREKLAVGDRVAIMLKNCPTWVVFDQAALGLGLVTVPLYVSDRPENVAYVLQDSGAKLLLVNSTDDWHPIDQLNVDFTSLQRVVTYKSLLNDDNDQRSLVWINGCCPQAPISSNI